MADIQLKGLYSGIQKATEQTLNIPNLWFNQEGVVLGLNVTASSPTSLNCNISAGLAMVNSDTAWKRYQFLLDIDSILGFDTAPSVGNSRNDLVVIEVTVVGSTETNGVVKIVKGTPAPTGTQVDPDLIETTGLFYLVLARVTLTGGSSVITTSDITLSGNSSKGTHNNTQAVSSTIFPIKPQATFENQLVEDGKYSRLDGSNFTGGVEFSTNSGLLTIPKFITATLATNLITAGQVAYDTTLNLFKGRDNSGVFSFLRNIAGEITTSLIANLAVTTGKIADGAITQAKLGADISFIPRTDTKIVRIYNVSHFGGVYYFSDPFLVNTGTVTVTSNSPDADGMFVGGSSNNTFYGYNTRGAITRTIHEPTIIIKVKSQGTLPSTANTIYFLGLSSNITNVTGARIGVQMTYNTSLNLVPTCSDGTTTATGTSLATLAINTVYTFKIRLVNVSGTYTAYFSVNGGSEVAINTNLPSTTTDLYAVSFTSNGLAGANAFMLNLESIYYEGK